MKFLTFITFLALILNLHARQNPFELANAYKEEKARIMEENETSLYDSIREDAYIKEMQEKMNDLGKKEKTTVKQKPMKKEEKVYTKEEMDKIISKTKRQSEYKTKQLIKKEIAKEIKTRPEQIVYVKPRVDTMSEDDFILKEILPFVHIEYNDDKIIIKSDDRISKKFTLNKENKVVIDYKAKKSFYTKRENLDSKNFSKITIGNHKKYKYYRVVVQLKSKPSNFKVDYENNLLTISAIN